MKDHIILIPARLGSTRLPNKPLAEINGITMIQRVYNIARKANIGDVYVACCEEKVVENIKEIGGRAILTDPEIQTGTDRIYNALLQIDNYQKYKFVTNLQGDLPNISPIILTEILNLLRSVENADITTAITSINNKEDETNPNVVKAIIENKKEKSCDKSRNL